MAKQVFYGMVIAAAALTSLPALAQTVPTTRPAPSPGMTATSPLPATSPAASTGSSSSSTYYTSEHQLRASKLVGANVYNDQNQSIGSINDVLLSDADMKAGTAVISVGGFLGIASKLVSVPINEIKVQDDKVVMPGATKASLEGMPDFKYNKV
jgi:sporulation protein YlmC with PRC-barrel domain